LPITQHLQLFSIIKNIYGGDGTRTFKLPDMRGKAALSCGQGEGLSHYELAETGGVETVTLTESQLPKHSHAPVAKKAGYAPVPNDKMVWAAPAGRPGPNAYATTKGEGATMNAAALDFEGGNAPHNNLMPYLVMNFYIAWEGEYPQRP
jgi:microcystin-dependent protein